MPIDISKISSAILGASSQKSDVSKTNEPSGTGEKRNEGGSSSSLPFQKGQVFRGQITNITPKEITIELENGESLNARYENISDLSIGDGAKFKVLSNVDHKLEIKALLSSKEGIDTAVYKALEASGLPFSEKNEDLITALLKNELPVNKQMINQILQQSLKNTEVSVSNLVLMNKAGLPITPEFSAIFESYYNGSVDFSNKINEHFQAMLTMLDGLISEGREEVAIGLTENILSALNTGKEADTYSLSLLSEPISSPKTDVSHWADFSKLLKENFAERNSDTSVENTSDILELLKHPETPLSTLFTEEELLTIFSSFENSDADAGILQKLITGGLSLEEFSNLINELTEEDRHNSDLFPKVLRDLSENLIPRKDYLNPSHILPQEATLSEAANLMKDLLKSHELSQNQKLSLLKSPEMRSTLELLVKTNFTLSPEELLREDALKEYYFKSDLLLDKLSNLALEKAPLTEAFSKTLSSMKESLQFLNTLAPYYSFVELPLRLHGQTTKGDLYVYTNKKKKMGDGSISCLLHLDMQNLGAMNVRIELNGSKVSTKFYLEEEEAGKLIAANLSELDKAVNRQGFLTESEVVNLSKKKETSDIEKGRYNLVKDFIPSELSKNNFTRYTFDVRA